MKRTLIFSIFSIMIIAGTSCTQLLRGSSPSEIGSESAATPQPVEKVLSAFSPITGTNYMLARISADPASRERSGNPLDWIQSSYSSSGYDTFNYVFFDLGSETYYRLLPTNDTVILQTMGFPLPEYNPSDPAEPPPPFEWWLYVIAKVDTDQNGQLGYGDKLTLGISDVGGNGYTDVITDVDNLLGEIYKDSSAFFVMYNSSNKNYIAKINLSTREVVTTTEMDLGEDMKK